MKKSSFRNIKKELENKHIKLLSRERSRLKPLVEPKACPVGFDVRSKLVEDLGGILISVDVVNKVGETPQLGKLLVLGCGALVNVYNVAQFALGVLKSGFDLISLVARTTKDPSVLQHFC